MRLYQMQDSGNCYKVRLLAAHLAVPLDLVEVDITRGESRTDTFLAKNPNGRIPLLQLDDGRHLAESNAILWWLSAGTALRPPDQWHEAQLLQWLFFEQYSHEPYIATVRYWMHILGDADGHRQLIEQRRPGGYAALAVMDNALAQQDYLVGGQFSVADIALYAYTHVAHQGGFDLAGFPAVQAWIDRVAAQPRHITIDADASGPDKATAT